jgi:hypothetical protein
MSINIYNKHAQTKRERETDWKKDRFPRNQNKTQTHAQTRLPLLLKKKMFFFREEKEEKKT